mgnify:CR=1 FL=1
MSESCSNCKYSFYHEDLPAGMAFCRRDPPRLASNETQMSCIAKSKGPAFMGFFPIVQTKEMWCGEWKPDIEVATSVPPLPPPAPKQPDECL